MGTPTVTLKDARGPQNVRGGQPPLAAPASAPTYRFFAGLFLTGRSFGFGEPGGAFLTGRRVAASGRGAFGVAFCAPVLRDSVGGPAAGSGAADGAGMGLGAASTRAGTAWTAMTAPCGSWNCAT
jgi:hypothetical protein